MRKNTYKVTVVTKIVRTYLVSAKTAEGAMWPIEDLISKGKRLGFHHGDTHIANVQRYRKPK